MLICVQFIHLLSSLVNWVRQADVWFVTAFSQLSHYLFDRWLQRQYAFEIIKRDEGEEEGEREQERDEERERESDTR